MKKSLFVIVYLVLTTSIFAQKKYPSLLWEIKKENQRPSYLYGTMHVSERIAFHLSDVFFEKILETDKIALESNPETWLDEMQDAPEMSMMGNMFGYGKFYADFALRPLQTPTIQESFFFNNFLLNGILYRTYDQFDDYQEDTYLDMFIYQTGKRTNREIVSLEDFQESRDLVEKAMKSNRNFDPPSWAKKMMMEKPLPQLMENAYRDKNLDMLDSISIGTNSPKYNEYMLFSRNENMVKRMDSIFQKGETLFIGIGAAHLPGNKGVIEKLRERGYIVTPVLGDYTQKGKAEKERLDHAFHFSNYMPHSTSDKFLALDSPSKIYEFDMGSVGVSISPDLKNGSYINVLRLKKLDFLRKDDYRSELAKVDSLLFENIPGKILKKEFVKIQGFDAIDVSNKTKDGDHQRYWIISTPIEYLIVSMMGKYEFVDLNSQKIKNSIQLKPITQSWMETTTLRGGFKVLMPSFQTISSNDPKTIRTNDPQIFAYDPTEDAHYFLIEKSLNDVEYLEESEFELKRIHYEFYKALKIDSLNGKLEKQPLSFRSEGKINDHRKIQLKSFVNGTHYYLLGTTAKSTQADKFFNSFQLDNFHYLKESYLHRDTLLNLEVRTQYKPMKDYSDYDYYRYEEASEKNHFVGANKSREFQSDSRKSISVKYREFDRYESFENIDSLWNEVLRNNKKLYEFEAEEKKLSRSQNGDYVMEVYFKKPLATQKVKAKFISNGKYFYSLKTLVPMDYKENDGFIEEFYSSLKPNPSKKETSTFDKKINIFLEDIHSSEDSIRLSALKSIYQIKFKDEDFPTLVELLENYEFAEEEEEYKNSLVKKIANLKHPKAEEFLKTYYRKNSEDSDLQMGVLESFASKKTKEDYESINQLLKEDIPLPSPNRITRLFGQFHQNKNLSSKILSDLMDYRTIPEYQDNIISLAASLVDSGVIHPNKLKSYRKDFLTLGKLEMKRSYNAWKSNTNSNHNYYDYEEIYVTAEGFEDGPVPSAKPRKFSTLKNYLILLQPYSHDSEVDAFLKKVDGLEVPDLMLFSLEQKLKNKDEIPSKLLNKIMEKTENFFPLYSIYKTLDKVEELPKRLTKEKIAKSAIQTNIYNFDEKKDSLEFITSKKATYKDKEYEIFFFKSIMKNKYSSVEQKRIHTIAFELDKDKNFKTEQKNRVYFNSGNYIDDESLEETIKNDIDKVFFRDKKRVSFDNNDYYSPMMMY